MQILYTLNYAPCAIKHNSFLVCYFHTWIDICHYGRITSEVEVGAFFYLFQLDIGNFGEVQEAIWEARPKWYNIGVRLKLEVSDLDAIKAESGIDLEEKFNRMINCWLKSIESRTWATLYEALKHPTVAMPNVADKVKTLKLGTSTGEF